MGDLFVSLRCKYKNPNVIRRSIIAIYDPLAEQMYGLSPYDCCGGNPIVRIDKIIINKLNLIGKMPGKEFEYIMYDKKRRMILYHDGNLRVSNKWIYRI